jgi:hypothetical protein
MPLIAIAFLLLAAWMIFSACFSPGRVDGIDLDLLNATKGDKALAKRLLQYARNRYPGKSEQWYTEKVIYDLQRDGACGNWVSARRRTHRREKSFATRIRRLFR